MIPKPSNQEIADALYGTAMLAKQDPGGLHRLDGSVDGFWKSFYAAVLLAPAYALLLWMGRYGEMEGIDLGAVFFVEAVAYVGAWLFWPVLASEICRVLDPKLDVRTYIVACNWSEIWIMLVRFPLLTLLVWGVFSDGLYALISLITLFAVLYYRFLIARQTLPAETPFATGMAVTDLIAGLMWRYGADMAIAPWLAAAAVTS